MIVGNMNDVFTKQINADVAKNAAMKVLVGEQEGWVDHVMRVVEVKQDGYTPKHSHPWPHINYVIEGNGEIFINGKSHPVQAGSFAYIDADSLHQFRNVGEKTFKFICIVPKEGHVY